ncbi:hypothetical protein KSS87_009090, partial [Heliosperma pusillum]
MVCQLCDAVMGPNVTSLPPPGLDGKKSSGTIWNGAVCWIAIVVVLVWRYCRGKGCRVHDS